MNKPFIQIDDEVREMTDEEYAHYLEATQNVQPLGADNDN
jgi:hypothetical protein